MGQGRANIIFLAPTLFFLGVAMRGFRASAVPRFVFFSGRFLVTTFSSSESTFPFFFSSSGLPVCDPYKSFHVTRPKHLEYPSLIFVYFGVVPPSWCWVLRTGLLAGANGVGLSSGCLGKGSAGLSSAGPSSFDLR